MNIFQLIGQFLREIMGEDTTTSAVTAYFNCDHPGFKERIRVTVLGVACELIRSPECVSCAEKYLNEFSVLCHTCRRPIFPGEPVADAGVGSPPQFAHTRFQCSDAAGYCGHWGEGKLVPILYKDAVRTKATQKPRLVAGTDVDGKLAS
ncbi:MAG TPA: hypothetical protein VD967_01905 [Candidatus Paceibacterota bacterium]|nr:hypothetical protein [Candidatus Paceibacterota bacterium]